MKNSPIEYAFSNTNTERASDTETVIESTNLTRLYIVASCDPLRRSSISVYLLFILALLRHDWFKMGEVLFDIREWSRMICSLLDIKYQDMS